MNRGTAILVAAVAAAIVLPLLALGLQLPLWLAATLGATAAGGLWLVLRSIGPAAGSLTDEDVLAAQSDTARDLAATGSSALARLNKALAAIKDASMRDQVQQLAKVGDKVLRDVRTTPDRAMAVRRLLTFYLPNAASLAEGWIALESRAQPSPSRAAQTRDTMHNLCVAFDKFADDVSEPQLQTLDVDLKVLNDALKSDLETAK